MMIFKKAIPRRTFLRGVGATLALPLLDAMVPAFAATDSTDAKPRVRLSVVYVPCGIIMEKWTPATEGANFELLPILQPLASFRDNMLVLSGLASANYHFFEETGAHPRAACAFLTGLHPTHEGLLPSNRAGELGISMDQLAAKELGKQTQLASLELCTDSTEVVGKDDDGYSAAFTTTISWRGVKEPTPMENQPRAVFERMFGDSNSTDPAERLAAIHDNRSILDLVTQDVSRLLKDLGPSDGVKLTEYLDSIRDVERHIQKAEEQSSQQVPTLEKPVGVPGTFKSMSS